MDTSPSYCRPALAVLTNMKAEEAARQKSVFSNLHTLRNPYPFVSRLPTETLQDIFIHCARDYHYHQGLYPTKSVPSWVNVSHVCRHWRNVALESPTLWSYLFIISRRWTEVLLARSKQASLKIRVSLVSRKIQELSCVGMVMNHVERIQELLLYLPASFDHSQVLSKLSSRAPRLRNLDITVEDPSGEWPSLLFDGDPPALRTLQLVACPVPLHSFRLNALTVLRLVNVPVQFQQNTEEFLAALSCMHDLKHLFLYHALPSATGFLSSAVFKAFQKKIDLTHLSRLWIGAPLSTTVTLLSCINIPLKTQVRLECNFEPNSSLDHYTVLHSFLAQKYNDQAQSTPTILSLIVQSTERRATLTFSPRQRDTTSITYEAWGRDIPLHIELDHSMVDEDVISGICSSMPLSNVQTLSVHRPWFSPAFWRRILRQVQDVRYITLHGGDMPDLSVLSLADHGATHDSGGEDVQNHGGLGAGDQGQSHMLAPRLEELDLAYISFLPDDGPILSGHAITRRCLFDALSTRQGSPGRLVITRGCIPGSGTFDMFAVWGDDGFHVVSEKVYSPEMDSEASEVDWAYGDDESVRSPEVDLEEKEVKKEGEGQECVHYPGVDSEWEEEEEGAEEEVEEEEESWYGYGYPSDVDSEDEDEDEGDASD
ncbi:hypothetical protein L210DRAFT_3763916 [Boletus edulis BED1]|uniref:F-box domain-containing protein n=1 Tax=Boletus edulis BED1 TaxID=1328754 RepID=A0AAD4BJP6_BOLED|nr:hypothetical protein L210DRAFT_3763916 [Boletus edulis BED1]